MVQWHGASPWITSFFFDLIIQKMPSGVSNPSKCVDIANNLATKYGTTQLEEKLLYEVKLSDEVSFKIGDWFRSDLDLGLPYVPPEREHPLVNIPLPAIRIQVTVGDRVGQYKPAQYRDLVVETIGNEALPELPDTEWWHFVATAPQTFVFLQDTGEPKVIPISQAESYVRIAAQPARVEKEWVFPQGPEYERISEDREEELSWHHIRSGTTINLWLEQRIHPIAAYEHYMLQLQRVKELPKYELYIIPKASQDIIDQLRRLVDQRWIILLSNNNDLLLSLIHI